MSNNSTMVPLRKDTEKCDKSVKCVTMNEAFLNDLLECSVCLQQLDSSSKVLPCQHTFCKRCLYAVLYFHKELRCPECRMLVDAKIETLPCNILLVRLLDGMKSNVWIKEDGSNIVPRNAESSSLSNQQPTPQPQFALLTGNLPQIPSTTDVRMVPPDEASEMKKYFFDLYDKQVKEIAKQYPPIPEQPLTPRERDRELLLKNIAFLFLKTKIVFLKRKIHFLEQQYDLLIHEEKDRLLLLEKKKSLLEEKNHRLEQIGSLLEENEYLIVVNKQNFNFCKEFFFTF